MIKIYVNAFKIDDIDVPEVGADLRTAALTNKVKNALGDEEVLMIHPTPSVNPKFIMIYTEF